MTYEELQEELRQADATIDVLKGALAAETAEAIGVPRWAAMLSIQQRAVVGALIAKYPRFLSRETITNCIPHREHMQDYDPRDIQVVVHNIRKKLGPIIETVKGFGYRASPSFMESLQR